MAQTVGNEGAVGGVLTRSSSADCDSRKARVGGSAPVDTEQLIDELGLTWQDLTAALRASDVEYLLVRWPKRITYGRSDPSTLVERITSRAREAVGLWPSTEARQTAQPRPGHDQKQSDAAPARFVTFSGAVGSMARRRRGARA